MDTTRKRYQSKLRIPIWIEPNTFRYWLSIGTLSVTAQGDENTYASDEFGTEFFTKLEG